MSEPDFREAGHLPKQRPEGDHYDPRRLPRQRRGRTPQMHGRYPDYDVLEQARHWDPVTRRVVLDRAQRVPPLRFFDADEARTLRPFCDHVLAQDGEPRIPVLHLIDEKLHAGRLEGYQYADLPDDRVVWKRAAAGLEEAAQAREARRFDQLLADGHQAICEAFAAGDLHGGAFEGMNVARAWKVVLRDIVAAFYSHPWAWNEIGFGGPAYPRGYMRLGIGMNEPYERDETGPRVEGHPTGAGG